MKNTKLFEKMRQEAIAFDKLLSQQIKSSRRMETISYKAWRKEEDNVTLRKKFHEWCEKTRQLEKRKERNEPFAKEKWYMSEYLFSDRHAYEVVEVYSWRKMAVRQLKATEVPEAKEKRMTSFIPGGFVGHFDNSLQEWTYESDESNPILIVRQHSDGWFYRPNTRTCPFIPQTEPYEYYDFNF